MDAKHQSMSEQLIPDEILALKKHLENIGSKRLIKQLKIKSVMKSPSVETNRVQYKYKMHILYRSTDRKLCFSALMPATVATRDN